MNNLKIISSILTLAENIGKRKNIIQGDQTSINHPIIPRGIENTEKETIIS